MTYRSRPVRRLARADEDVLAALDHYLTEAPEHAGRFLDAIEQAVNHIGRAPATGSPSYAHELNLPGVRSWPCSKFPYLVFYMEHDDRIDIWRVLHMKRDIPTRLQEPDFGEER